jgi:hypothetical protein
LNRRQFTGGLFGAAAAASGCATGGPYAAADALRFDPARYNAQQVKVGDDTVAVRAYEGLPVVARPVEPDYQALNLYVPEAYFQGGRVGRHDARSAPIFLPNAVGGYMPARPGTLASREGSPGGGPQGAAAPSASAVALARGFVVAAPGARGRTLRAADGRWTGKAPAAIVDLKAAVRWLRHNAGRLPGDVERIVSNGTSAGGALSALLGASGNHPSYEAELQALGAAPGRDNVHAVSAFCPITNLAHADEAYEWQFLGIAEYRNVAISMLDFRVQRQEVAGRLDERQLALSAELQASFVDHVNALGLRAPDGRALGLLADGSGGLREHLQALLVASAQRSLDAGQDLSARPWVKVEGRRVTALDFQAHVRGIGRMKAFPAFDGLALETGENQLFGDARTDLRHFTDFSQRHSTVAGATRADHATVRQMDAMLQLGDAAGTVAPHWRIRHGTMDRDTAFAVPALLAAAARRRGATVDLDLPWDRPHSGDYDLDQLFDWAEAAVATGRG